MVTRGRGGPGAGGGALPPAVGAEMEATFGADFSGVRVHESAQASSLGAVAFTQGSDIHFAPGQYDPHSAAGKELLGHELTHVVQQRDGRVGATGAVGGVPHNDDPALEREADDSGARAARGQSVGHSARGASSSGGVTQHKAAAPDDEDGLGIVEDPGPDSISLAGGATTPAVAQTKLAIAPIQAQTAGAPRQRQNQQPGYVSRKVYVTRPMTRDEFRITAMRQIFGRILTEVTWTNSLDSYVPEKSPYTVDVQLALLRQERTTARRERGFTVDENGDLPGAKQRAKDFDAGPGSDQKSGLLKEIDRRYHEAMGDAPGARSRPGEPRNQELWRRIRDEVLFEYEAIKNLPPQLKELIKLTTGGKELSPADYDKLFAIIKKLEQLPPGLIGDYASKVTKTTTDLDAFDASIDRYIAEMAGRTAQAEERDKIQTKLAGLEEVYKKYQTYKLLLTTGSGGGLMTPESAGAGLAVAREAGKLREELDAELPRYGFAGVTEFEAFIKKFEQAFELESANIAKDVLAK